MLQEKILSKLARVAIVGLGYVGLPLAILCVKKGFEVIGIDIDENKISTLNNGRSYISEISDIQVKSTIHSNRLSLTCNFSAISTCDIIIICVPTPLTSEGKPNYSFLFNSIESIAQNLGKEKLIIVESTIIPNTTRNSIIPKLEKSGFKVGKDFFLAFSPERIDPGNSSYQLQNTCKLVSGYSIECRKLTELFYNQLNINTFAVNSLEVAEMSKILENTYRDVNIALINEMAQICHTRGLNIWDVIEAASTKPFGFQQFYPGPGVGGHCIPKDSTFYVYWAKKARENATLAECARRINDSMPHYIITRLEELLAKKEKIISGSNILILGVTYKNDVNDLRQSPAVKIIELLLSKGALISFHDPYIKQLCINESLFKSVDFEILNKAKQDCIVMAVAHNCYRNFQNYNANIIFDLTNTIDKNICNLSTL